MESQNPSTKLQISTNDQMIKTKNRSLQCFCLGHWNLELGIYLEFGICDLEFELGSWRENLPSWEE
jgi:hypothetical protein